MKSAVDQLVDWMRPSNSSDVRGLAGAIQREERERIKRELEARGWIIDGAESGPESDVREVLKIENPDQA